MDAFLQLSKPRKHQMNLNSEQFVLLKRPVGLPDPSSFGLEKTMLKKSLQMNEVRLHGLYYSVDPYMRGRMNAGKSYVEPFVLNEPIEGSVIARVAETNSKDFKTGNLVFGQLPWSTEMIVPSDQVHKIDTTHAHASEYLGVLGMTGLTAYFGFLKIGQPQAGETVVISGAAGAVGSVVGQIAKIKGCKVIGIVGSDAKSDFLKDRLHFDQTINYNEPSQMDNLKKILADGVDVYFDNVGGSISDAVLPHMNFQGRVVLCGQISQYNVTSATASPIAHPFLINRSVSTKQFMVTQFKDQYPEALKQLNSWMSEGRLESKETIIEGFDNLPRALLGLFSGENIGKMIVKAMH
jgi:NADPH-dependent curcumin reductase CurA